MAKVGQLPSDAEVLMKAVFEMTSEEWIVDPNNYKCEAIMRDGIIVAGPFRFLPKKFVFSPYHGIFSHIHEIFNCKNC